MGRRERKPGQTRPARPRALPGRAHMQLLYPNLQSQSPGGDVLLKKETRIISRACFSKPSTAALSVRAGKTDFSEKHTPCVLDARNCRTVGPHFGGQPGRRGGIWPVASLFRQRHKQQPVVCLVHDYGQIPFLVDRGGYQERPRYAKIGADTLRLHVKHRDGAARRVCGDKRAGLARRTRSPLG